MAALKPLFGVIRSVFPVLYCGYLLYYFLDLTGSVAEAKANGLGPTLLGLAVVGLLFCIPLFIKVIWLVAPPRQRRDPDASAPDDDDGFDADAAIARYKARQAAEVTPVAPPRSAPPASGASTQRPSFGRKKR